MGEAPQPGGYDEARGAKVIAWARRFLDEVRPAGSGSHADVTGYRVGAAARCQRRPRRRPSARRSVAVRRASRRARRAVGGAAAPSPAAPGDRDRPGHRIGRTDAAGVADLLLEAAVTTIMDCEDSVAAVDGEDKALAYRNWLGS
jgi:malate synthase